jgi:hypothetical protein
MTVVKKVAYPSEALVLLLVVHLGMSLSLTLDWASNTCQEQTL